MLLISTAVVFAVVYSVTGTELRQQIDRDLSGESAQLLRFLATLSNQPRTLLARTAGEYVRAEPYSATSRLIFVQVPGLPPAANHPELFGHTLPDHGERAAQQQAENREGRRLLRAKLGFSTDTAPDVGAVRVLKRQVGVGFLSATIGVAEPLASVDHAQASVAKAFLLASLAAVLLALVASYLAGAQLSAPLRRMASVAARVDAGDLAPRMETDRSGRGEVDVLAESFNRMLSRLQEAFAQQRAFVADASHELRTPLTVIAGQLEVLAANDAPPAAEVRRVEELVHAEVQRMSRMVDDLLLLARTERLESLRAEPLQLPAFVHDLWDGVQRTAQRRFRLGPVPDGTLTADPDRLAGALRNLARNAIEHTGAPDGLVRLDVGVLADGRVAFTVTDDGPGIPSAERERVFERFHRTDNGRSRSEGGAGLGLAIVRAVAEAHDGSAQALPGQPEGGARVQIVIPGFEHLRG